MDVANGAGMGAPLPVIAEAVLLRGLSTFKDERVAAAGVLPGPQARTVDATGDEFLCDLEAALYATTIVAYAQGFQLLRAAQQKWPLELVRIAGIWCAGRIILRGAVELHSGGAGQCARTGQPAVAPAPGGRSTHGAAGVAAHDHAGSRKRRADPCAGVGAGVLRRLPLRPPAGEPYSGPARCRSALVPAHGWRARQEAPHGMDTGGARRAAHQLDGRKRRLEAASLAGRRVLPNSRAAPQGLGNRTLPAAAAGPPAEFVLDSARWPGRVRCQRFLVGLLRLYNRDVVRAYLREAEPLCAMTIGRRYPIRRSMSDGPPLHPRRYCYLARP